jgi:hypothetical protein
MEYFMPNMNRELWHVLEKDFERVSYYEDKTSEIDFIVRTPFHEKKQNAIALEAKETPTSADLTALCKYAKKLGITNTRIIGSQKSAK